MKWSTARTLEEKGKGLDSTPKWPEVKLRKKGTCEGCEREGERQESYIVHFVDSKSKEDYTCSYDSPKKWESFGKGDSYKVRARMVGGLDGSSLQR